MGHVDTDVINEKRSKDVPSLYSLKRSDMMLEFDYINIYIYIP